VWAGAFSAIAPVHLYYSQEARTYAVLVVLVLLVHVLVWRALEQEDWQSWALVLLAVAGALYSHYVALFALPSTAWLVWVRNRHREPRVWGRYGVAVLGGVAVVVPWMAWTFALRGHSVQGIAVVAQIWEHTPPALAIPKSLEVLGLGSQGGSIRRFPKSFPLSRCPTGSAGWD